MTSVKCGEKPVDTTPTSGKHGSGTSRQNSNSCVVAPCIVWLVVWLVMSLVTSHIASIVFVAGYWIFSHGSMPARGKYYILYSAIYPAGRWYSSETEEISHTCVRLE